ncbi:TIGR01777 family oxidoreductase [Aeromicrobium wangtongii]|uniref:TIGR01777 family oxidoreductase n=1 Tax=Aeromicrobium wangtongii TaxID=2969247 RepID=A0ABY5MCT8_9ACTN|nr:TIGR01777 family oxidoreductase [Aeromicrobium wangtongii]MCD9197494.1 TIGR01777 family oxidoreductase [Aeromicrobium wangtongii]UUP14986.1 TIGR01777 family oxidoreductase [Aeromicrobium wangtongii]
MHVVVGGASGFLGTALTTHLRARGHEVTRLVRSGDLAADASRWDPAAGRIDQALIDRADAVVNLSGSQISKWPRTAARRSEILSSRLAATDTLAKAVAASSTPTVFISGSGMSWYGTSRPGEVLTEQAGPGTGFLAEVAQQWEAAAAPAVEAGARTCFVRTSLVLSKDGGVLALMLPAWKLGGGARLGSGQQHMSLISRHDWVRGVEFLLEHDTATGPFNFAMPAGATNAEFTDALGQAVHRPTFLAVPGVAVRAALGGISDDLLGSLRIFPSALADVGFTFADPDLRATLDSALA